MTDYIFWERGESFAENDEPDGVFEQDIEAIDIAVKAMKENDKLKQLLEGEENDYDRKT